MTKVDQFESVFRAAAKPVFELAAPEIRKVLIATDFKDADAAAAFGQQIRRFLAVLGDVEWSDIGGSAFTSADALLATIHGGGFDLVVTYRHLHSRAWRWPHSLGTHLDVLAQAARCPVLVVPHPERNGAMPHALRDTDVVMAITDHLAGDQHLVSWAARFTMPNGTLLLTHVEDETTFQRYRDVLSKIPSVDTESTADAIRAQLLKEPTDYIASCRQTLLAAQCPVTVTGTVIMGHRLREYQQLIAEHEVDLLVLNTKDDDQMAMHGMAYPLAVQVRDIPLLLL